MITALTVGVRDAPVALREQLTPSAERLTALRDSLRDRWGGEAVLATCNRFEVYVPGEVDERALIESVACAAGIRPDVAERAFRVHRGSAAVRHLFEVASGLDSVVVGEFEILGQVRRLLEAGSLVEHGAVLDRVLRSAVHLGRQVRSQTAIAAGRLSLFTLAAEEVATRVAPGAQPRIVILGAGEAARHAGVALRDRGYQNLVVVNRTLERAQALAAELNSEASSLATLRAELARADVIIGAVAVSQRLVGDVDIEEALRVHRRPLTVVDLATPRCIDPNVALVPGVSAIHVDDLTEAAERNSATRREAVPQAQALVASEVHRFARWHRAYEATPSIASLTAAAEALRQAQVKKTLRLLHASEEQAQHIEALTQSLVRQLLYPQIEALRDCAPARAPGARRSRRRLDEPHVD